MMIIGVPKEIHENERRVGLTPEGVEKIKKTYGYDVIVEAGAGQEADYLDAMYEKAGATIAANAKDVWGKADLIVKVRAPEQNKALSIHESELLRSGSMLISFIWPAQNAELLEILSKRGATVFGMDQVPRISRAQKMDALSSMANIAGYRAVIEAAHHFGRFFTGQMTAAGKVPPAKVMVIGAGVAGLAAIGTAKALGAIVRAFDTRPEVKDQVKSMGAEFLELDFKEEGSGTGGYAKVMSKEFIEAEMKLFMEQAKDVDIIVTTALIPGKPAPELITEDMVKQMKGGSVIVDLAAEQGGNCKLTEANKVVVKHGVTLIGYTDLPSRLPQQASRLYSANILHFLHDLHPDKEFKIDMNDEVIRGSIVLHKGEITWPPPKVEKKELPKPPPAAAVTPKAKAEPKKTSGLMQAVLGLLGAAFVVMLAASGPASFLAHFTVFVLACFVGWQVVWSVTAALHTPLMSVTNAISGIIVIGAIVQLNHSYQIQSCWGIGLSVAAILVATINVVGGFWVTQRMLKMFHR